MNASPPLSNVTLRPPRRAAPAAGFGLIELSVVLAIISVLLAIGAPLARHLLTRARVAAVGNDLRVFSAAFSSYAQERGDWPPGDGTPGSLPPDMASYLNTANWSRPTPFGGYYAWDPQSLQQGSRHRAVIVIAGTSTHPVISDRHQLLQLDARLDDGDFTTGNLVLGYRNQPVYILEH